ncbi:MAG: hypothetical protein ACN0LA_11905 [Candidatus Longimicrobiales bacterium M2_2A_002]
MDGIRMMWIRSVLAGITVLVVLALQGCGGHHLADYDFADRSLAVVYYTAPAPELWTGGYDVEGDNPLEVVVSAGGRVAREVEARRAQARLDSAASRLDLAEGMAGRTLERASRYLGTRAVEDESEADYLLEVDVRDMGLDAGRDAAYLVVRAEVVLLDGRTGREIWDADVNGRDRLTPGVSGSTDALGDVVTAGALSSVSVDDFETILRRLTDFVADRVARELRSDLRDARD